MTMPPPDQWRPPPPQQPSGPPPSSPKRVGALKWILGTAVLVVVIAVTVAATIFFTRNSSDSNSPASPPKTSRGPSDIASANDDGPVKIITEDPTCAPWVGINNALASRQSNGWTNRDPSSPAVTWLRSAANFTDVGDAFDEAADQTVPLVKMTPHRVMRELYEQFIAYGRAYSDSLPLYTGAG